MCSTKDMTSKARDEEMKNDVDEAIENKEVTISEDKSNRNIGRQTRHQMVRPMKIFKRRHRQGIGKPL